MASAVVLGGALLLLTLVGVVLLVWWLIIAVCFLPLIALVTLLPERHGRRVEAAAGTSVTAADSDPLGAHVAG